MKNKASNWWIVFGFVVGTLAMLALSHSDIGNSQREQFELEAVCNGAARYVIKQTESGVYYQEFEWTTKPFPLPIKMEAESNGN